MAWLGAQKRWALAKWLNWSLAAAAVVLIAQPQAPALAAGADDAEASAKKGAESFKNNQFFEAAMLFERAAQLDPADPRNLRYAGRAWQEVGHWKRALVLLEAYLRIESNAEHRASIMDKIEILRRASPVQVAEALTRALAKYPQARLEADAARAWEEAGTEGSIDKALELWEIARVRAVTDADKASAEAGIQRVAQRKLDVKANRDREAATAKREQQERAELEKVRQRELLEKQRKSVAPQSGGPGALQIALYTSGGVALVGGLSLAVVGYLGAVDVNDRAVNGAYKDGPYAKYTSDLAEQDKLAYAGWGLAALGAGAVGWAWLSTPKAGPGRTANWQWLPHVGRDSAGLALVGPF